MGEIMKQPTCTSIIRDNVTLESLAEEWQRYCTYFNEYCKWITYLEDTHASEEHVQSKQVDLPYTTNNNRQLLIDHAKFAKIIATEKLEDWVKLDLRDPF